MNESQLIILVGVVAVAVYLFYSLNKKSSAPSSGGFISVLDNAVVNAANGITGLVGDYEFNSDTGDPNDTSNVFIPSM